MGLIRAVPSQWFSSCCVVSRQSCACPPGTALGLITLRVPTPQLWWLGQAVPLPRAESNDECVPPVTCPVASVDVAVLSSDVKIIRGHQCAP